MYHLWPDVDGPEEETPVAPPSVAAESVPAQEAWARSGGGVGKGAWVRGRALGRALGRVLGCAVRRALTCR